MRGVSAAFARHFLVALFLLLGARLALADDCQLKEVASLDTVVSNDGNILVPVGLETASGYLILDFSRNASILTASAVQSVQVKGIAIPGTESINYNGLHATLATYANIRLGNASGKSLFAVVDGKVDEDPRAVGVLGYNVLKHFDIELDLAHNKVNLFQQDHCPGKVVYWTHTAAIAAAPIKFLGITALNVPVQLDGKDVNAQISTSTRFALLHRHIARTTFGIAASDDPPSTDDKRPDAFDSTTSKPYNFKTLTLDGIAISNPTVYPYGVDRSYICNGSTHEEPAPLRSEMRQMVTCYGEPDMFLGRSVLQQLRIYMALQEQMLYATAANAQ